MFSPLYIHQFLISPKVCQLHLVGLFRVLTRVVKLRPACLLCFHDGCVLCCLVLQRLVPGTRWVDLETDRGKPARLSSAYAAAAAAAGQPQQAGEGAAGSLRQQDQQQPPQQQQQDPSVRQVRPLDSASDPDHLAELEEYPLGSLTSFSSWDDYHENVPDWIRSFSPDMIEQPGRGGGGAPPQRLLRADSSIVGGNYLSHEQMHAIEAVLVEGSEPAYKPFCNTMLQQLQQSGAAGGSSSSSQQQSQQQPHALAPPAATSVVSVGGSARGSADGLQLSWELPQEPQDFATQQQLADWAAADKSTRGGRPGSSAAAQSDAQLGQQTAAAAGRPVKAPLPQEEQWGQVHKQRTMQKLLELEDSVLARDGDPEEYKPFCESMFQSL